MTTTPDSIEKHIDIAASQKTVWHLVSEPGWWINDGEVREHRIEQEGEFNVVHDPVHGAFYIKTVELREPTYAAFRWEPSAHNTDAEGAHTLTEFWIEERGQGVNLRVKESGFSTLDLSEAERRRQFDDNTEGWEQEMLAAKNFAERA